jgi:hypothetical protein
MVRLVGRLFGTPILKSEGLKVRPPIETIATSGATHRFEPPGGVPASERVLRDANIFGRLG